MAKDAVRLTAVKSVSNGALKSDDLPSRIKVLNWGTNKTLDGEITFDEESAKVFYANQRNIGRTLAPLDFNHNTVPGTEAYKSDKEPRAIAAYGVPTIYPGDGLWYEYVTWTPSGKEHARDYADLSPAVITDDKNRVIAMHSSALTPAGAIENLSFYSAENVSDLMKKCAEEVDVDGPGMEKAKKGAKKGKDEEIDEDEDQVDEYNKLMKIKSLAADLTADHESKYGDVEYADPKRHKYPINTEAHVRAAWSYIHMPKNQGGYGEGEISAIKRRIAKKAKTLGIELKAESAVKITPNAYVQDPYKGIDDMNEEHMKFFKAKLGLGDDATPDDVMKVLRAKLEGIETTENPLLQKDGEPNVTPEYQGGPPDLKAGIKGTPEHGSVTPHGTVTYNAEEDAKRKAEKIAKRQAEIKSFVAEALTEAVKPFAAEVAALKAEKEAKSSELEQAKRDALIAEASRMGKVIPLSAEEITALPVKTLESMVAKLTPEVPLHKPVLRAMTADGKVPELKGTRDNASRSMTEYFSRNGLQRGIGFAEVSPKN